MINVLQDWADIGVATRYLGERELPKHESAEKNWDFYHLCQLADELDRDSQIVDLGCGDGFTLRLLAAMGFRNGLGLDLSISGIARLRQWVKMWRGKMVRPPYRLRQGDLTRTGLSDGSIDLATCVSVIEHGVDLSAFLRESSRILKPGGLLFVTTDYWQEHIEFDLEKLPYNLSWKIFSQKAIEDFLELSHDFGFELYEEMGVPACGERCAYWNRQDYTFINLVLKKKTR